MLLTVETDTDEASEGEEDEEERDQEGRLPHVHYSGGPLRPSWVVVWAQVTWLLTPVRPRPALEPEHEHKRDN